MSDFTLSSAALHFASVAAKMIPAEHEILKEIGEAVEKEAKNLIGQEGVAGVASFPTWAPLADSTIEEKSRLGFTGHVSATDPELRTGELRDSYHHVVRGDTVTIGSDLDSAVATEMGTAHQPPRSVLGIATEHVKPEIEKLGIKLATMIVRK